LMRIVDAVGQFQSRVTCCAVAGKMFFSSLT
jgi:hypothetical protein